MPDTPPHRRESVWVAIITIVGAVLRFWGAGHLGLNHFDEGIYALAGTWIQSPKGIAAISPEVIAYAPPLFPTLVGVSYLIFGVSDVSAILVSQVMGVLTIPAVAWVGRRTFGPGAGIAAACLAAISGPHIAFSRMALTDSTFLFCWVLALGFGGRFLERPGILRAIPLGLIVGLAQNAKYNGYLTGGIVGLTAIWGLLVPSSEGRKGALKAIGYGLIAAGIALAVYWPWYRFVENQPGGYAALLRHHQGYLSGPSAWLSHWRLQTAQATALSGRITTGLGWGAIAFALAWSGGWFLTTRPEGEPRSRWSGMRFRLALIVGSAIFGLAASTPWWIALAVMPWLVVDHRPAVRLLALAWIVMAILTPFYHPYARLWLPLHSLGWVIVAGMIVEMARRWRIPRVIESNTGSWRQLPIQLGVALGLIGGVAHEFALQPRGRILGSPIEPTDSLRLACERVAATLKGPLTMRSPQGPIPSIPQRLHLVARPPVLFYMASRLSIPIQRHPDGLSMQRASVQLGDYVLKDDALESVEALKRIPTWTIRSDSYQLVDGGGKETGLMPVTTLLDYFPGRAIDTAIYDDQDQVLDLFRVEPL